MYIDKDVKLVSSSENGEELVVDIQNGRFRVYGGWNWGPANPIQPGPIECLFRARQALIAHHIDAIRTTDAGKECEAIWYLDAALHSWLSGVPIQPLPKELRVDGLLHRDGVQYHYVKTTTWRAWEAGPMNTTFEFTPYGQSHPLMMTSFNFKFTHSYYDWVDFVAGRKTPEMAADILSNYLCEKSEG